MNNIAYLDNGDRLSLFDRARRRNPQALAEWINHLLSSQGASVRVRVSSRGCLQVFLELAWMPENPEYLDIWRDRLVRCICHQVSTLKAQWIQGVQITARLAGYRQILWKQSVRIATPAKPIPLRQPSPKRRRTKQFERQVERDLHKASLFRGRVLTPQTKKLRKGVSTVNFKFFQLLLFISLATAGVAFAFNRPTLKPAQNPTATPQPILESPTVIVSPEPQSAVFSVPEPFEGKVVHRVNPIGKEKTIALTFDDGPWKKTTLQVLEILKKHEIQATFFLVGRNVKNYPEIAKAVVADGHAIGNHTWHHWYHQMNQATAAYEVEATTKLIYETTGVKTSLFRPPGGLMNNGVTDHAKKNNYGIMMWSIDSRDYRRGAAAKLAARVLKNPQSGDIVLLHDGGGDRSATVRALPQIIETLKQEGYKFVTIPQLLEAAKFEETSPENASLERNISAASNSNLVLRPKTASIWRSE